jgi:hypothetical protein
MYNPDTDLLFPPRVIPELRAARGASWRQLVARVSASKDNSVERMAFILMMVRLDGCASCNADSFRAMNGCTSCAKQALKRFRGADSELIKLYKDAKTEMARHLEKIA